MVAPSSMATSKSPLIPMEQCSRPAASRSSRRRLNHGRDASAVSAAGGMHMSPRTSRLDNAVRDSSRPLSSAGCTPPFCGSSATITCTRSFTPRSRLWRRPCPAAPPALLGHRRPDETPRYGPSESGDLLLRFLDAIFSQSPDPGRDGQPYPLDLHRLGHRDEEHVVRLSTGALAGASDALMHSLEVCANVLYQCLSGWPILARRAAGCLSGGTYVSVRRGKSGDGDQSPHLPPAIRVEEVGPAARAQSRIADAVARNPCPPKLLLI